MNKIHLNIKQVNNLFLKINIIAQVYTLSIYIEYNNIHMEDSLDFDYIFKYILVGDASVGKSTLLHMFVNNNFKG